MSLIELFCKYLIFLFCLVSSGFQCTDGNDTTVHPDTTNCYYFYQCIGFNAYRMPCPTGLQFNVANGTSDYSANAKSAYDGSPATLVPPIGMILSPIHNNSYAYFLLSIAKFMALNVAFLVYV